MKLNKDNLLKLLKITSKRIKINSYDYDDIIRLINQDNIDNRVYLENSERGLILTLVILCFYSKSRIEEFNDSLSFEALKKFIEEKYKKYLKLLSLDTTYDNELSKSDDIFELALLCGNLKSKAEKIYDFYITWNGEGPSIAENVIKKPKKTTKHSNSSFSKQTYKLRNRFILNDSELDFEELMNKLLNESEKYQVAIITYPRVVCMDTKSADDFECIIAHKSEVRIPTNIYDELKMRMIEHKIVEKGEIEEPNYKKRYTNLSLYINADAEVKEHKKVGFKNAMRYIIDLFDDMDTIYGMIDIRVINYNREYVLNDNDLYLIKSYGEKIKSIIELNIERSIPNTN